MTIFRRLLALAASTSLCAGTALMVLPTPAAALPVFDATN